MIDNEALQYISNDKHCNYVMLKIDIFLTGYVATQ